MKTFPSYFSAFGIASLDATSVARLGNEVSGIALADHGETRSVKRNMAKPR
jgi:hypothetical protein